MTDSSGWEETQDHLPGHGATSANGAPPEYLEWVGRYRVEKVLGRGGFGLVYLAYDEKLDRSVAIKVPHFRLMSNPEKAEAYLAEARTVANLDHPHIVPVYDVGSTDDCPFYIVSKYVDGKTLRDQIKESRPTWNEAAELIAKIAEALHYAHKRGLVHRDIKPGNILLDGEGQPQVVDFGLALKESNVGNGPRYAGTPTYMSPEQARGEGHRVDGRSDVYSLGAVFYEVLVGRRTFTADSTAELLEKIASQEVKPPRQIDDAVPKELERICLKALSKRASDRYPTALDMAEDLRHFLDGKTVSATATREGPNSAPGTGSDSTRVRAESGTAEVDSDSGPIRIVTKGLRSFDEHDSDFFLRLLPGPRDRDGLPDSIRFWKTRIEENDADKTFSVGLMYGPSGCGKSSLMKAGLLPRLSDHVKPIYLEATADKIEARLIKGLRKHCSGLPENLSLTEMLTALRRGEALAAGHKVLLVIDQFEQWLAERDEQNTELLHALRQCDGGRVQCVVMVRDDFWMAVTRFFRQLEVELVQRHNFAVVDLFDQRHAMRVLELFGRAFGALPETTSGLQAEQNRFLENAVTGLSDDGKVICVRLVLFAEMIKSKPWTTATLRQVGGTQGVGIAFLDETFSASTANPKHRLHQKAARGVLAALLPEKYSDIRGHRRSLQELLAAAEYQGRLAEFRDLIHTLDQELRLITPTDPETPMAESEESAPLQPQEKYYQLTHDYLVPLLREWLTRKQKETRRGRAELLLADLARMWSERPERRLLPSRREWWQVRMYTRSSQWSVVERRMMHAADLTHLARFGMLAILLVALTLSALAFRWQLMLSQHQSDAQGLVQRLLDANIEQVPNIVREIEHQRIWTYPLLRGQMSETSIENSSQSQMRLRLALLAFEPEQGDFLQKMLLVAEPRELMITRDALAAAGQLNEDGYWEIMLDERAAREERLRAACVLSACDATDVQWEHVGKDVVAALLSETATLAPIWAAALRPVASFLCPPLEVAYHTTEDSEGRHVAAIALAELLADKTESLVSLVPFADNRQLGVLVEKLRLSSSNAITTLQSFLTKPLSESDTAQQREAAAQERANVVLALFQLGHQGELWRRLGHSSDTGERTYLIHWLGPKGIEPSDLIDHLEGKQDAGKLQAILLSFGEYRMHQLPSELREDISEKAKELFLSHPDPGVHSSAEWLLRTWNVSLPNATDAAAGFRWYVNKAGHVMAVLDVPDELGSVPSAGEASDRGSTTQSIPRCFAIATKEVTQIQFERFAKEHPRDVRSPHDDCPVTYLTYADAARYCRWLSEQEDIAEDQMCYPPLDRPTDTEITPYPDYLTRTGYRLPTSEEWDFACRAGTTTDWFFGHTDHMLRGYAWFNENSKWTTWPVGTLRPNPFGLFDILGNVGEFCFDAGEPEGRVPLGHAQERGGTYLSPVYRLAPDSRSGGNFESRLRNIGFRVARTMRR